jgi:predicted secreted hydrolase
MHFWRDFIDLARQLFRVYGLRLLNLQLVSEVMAYMNFRAKMTTPPAVAPRPVVFPADEFPHGTTAEWWYVNARFKTSEGYPYAMHYSTLLVNTSDLIISRRLKKNHPIVPSIYFSLINLARKSNRRNARASGSCVMPTDHEFPFTIETDQDAFRMLGAGAFSFRHEKLKMELTATTGPILVNDNGFIDFPTGPSFYYCYPRMDLRGEMRLYDRTLPIKGTAWLDHQWTNDAYKPFRWVWLSVQFENGMDLVLAEWGLRERHQFATLRLPGGSQYTAHAAKLTANQKVWKSHRTGFVYPLEWAVEVPEMSLTLSVKAQYQDCEMTMGFLHYWEGPIEVVAQMQHQTLNGLGFMEQVQTPLSKV